MPLLSPAIFLQVHFLKRLKDMNKNIFSKDREVIQMLKWLCMKNRLKIMLRILFTPYYHFITELQLLAGPLFCLG